jgi:ubiquinone/menaquinone biosynthesis C-methylase UbiE
MSGLSQKHLVKDHFSQAAGSWSARYGDDRSFQNYNFIVRREHVLELFDREQGRYLDVGCGSGDFIAALIERGGEVFAIDVAGEMIRKARDTFVGVAADGKAHFSVADVTNLSFAENYFDAAVAVGLIEYLSDYETALKELYRVLKPGGILILTVPNLASPFMAFEVVTSDLRRLRRRAFARLRGHRLAPRFVHRHFLPWSLDRKLARAGFHKLDYAFCTYGLFSVPRLGDLFLALSEKLDRFSRSTVGILGTNYIVKVKKP